MRKAISLLLMLAMCLSLCACAVTNNSGNSNTEEPKATIINNNGQSESMTAKELKEIYTGNQVAFDNKYFGAKVTVIGKVESVHGLSSVNGHDMNAYIELEGGWLVEAEKQSMVADLMPGDTVKVTGCIYSAFVDVSIYIINGWGTTIEPYNG